MTSNRLEHDKSYVLEETNTSHLTLCMRPEPLASHNLAVSIRPDFLFCPKADSTK
ncbi:hypothetical protein PITC_065630 [Penicillium italicum]|uniref:Uncharacterized protein n=1 Tax=Penicillium italicum TaxID=40296 RepID=A0A0A2KT76_PENIT|nr:hypothetical protein PITC_065630 [Penicillium italicum]